MRNIEAIKRDDFIKCHPKSCDASTLRGRNANYYLQNRIEEAFLAGIEEGKKIALARITEHLKEIIQ